LGPGPENTYREFYSVAVNGQGRIAINEDLGFVEYDITGGQLVERCKLPGKQLEVRAIRPDGDGWIVLGTSQATGLRIFRIRQCQASPLSDPLEPDQSWLMASAQNISVIYASGQSQSVVFVATERGLQRVELPFVPSGLLFASDGPQPVLFFVGENGVSAHRVADP
jgi:hypothetical protein